MTLVETVVSLALAAMLMVALVGVLRGTAIQSGALDDMRREIWPNRFVRLLHRDLMAADSLWSSDGYVWLGGGLPGYASSRYGSVARVGYGCAEATESASSEEPVTMLVRVADGDRGLISIGVRRVVVERIDRAGEPQPLPPSPGPVPERVRVWLWVSASGPPFLTRDLVIR